MQVLVLLSRHELNTTAIEADRKDPKTLSLNLLCSHLLQPQTAALLRVVVSNVYPHPVIYIYIYLFTPAYLDINARNVSLGGLQIKTATIYMSNVFFACLAVGRGARGMHDLAAGTREIMTP